MSHHKRRRPKHQRAGCLLCKPHKDERAADPRPVSEQRQLLPDDGDFEPWEGDCVRGMCGACDETAMCADLMARDG